jgi:alkylmercury lyase
MQARALETEGIFIEQAKGGTMTNGVNLEDVARAVAAADPDFDADGQRIFVQTVRLLARGEPVSPAGIADAAGVPAEQAHERLRSWPLVFWDDQDRVTGFFGLAAGRLKTAHRIEANGLTVYGWCAWDTLFITEILGMETHVESADPLSGQTIRLTVTPQGVKEVRPAGVVVSLLRPDGPRGSDVVESFCHFVHFFASRESAERWLADHPGTFLLSVDEAFELGRLTNRLRAPDVFGGGEVVR